MGAPQEPSRAELEQRLRALRAALQEVPPHAAAGTRERLQAELSRMQRLLRHDGSSR